MRYLLLPVIGLGLLAGCDATGSGGASTGAAGPAQGASWVGPDGTSEGVTAALEQCQLLEQQLASDRTLGQDYIPRCMEANGFTRV